MPLLVEAIRADDGRFDDLSPHVERMERSRSALFGDLAPLNLQAALGSVSDSIGAGCWKVRVLYDRELRGIETALYVPKPYRSAALVDGGTVDYSYKTAERPELDILTRRAETSGADTALIIKAGRITDFSYANAAFFDGSSWWTPREPLLSGTRRERLLAVGRILETDITPDDLERFIFVSPINAMLDLGEIMMETTSIIDLTEEISELE